jgi:hypothetical protein
MAAKKFKQEERVRRASHKGCDGTVIEVRTELENGGLSEEAREKGVMVGVKWDNGTISFMAPEALEAA